MSIQHVEKNKKNGHSTLFEPHVERTNIDGVKKGKACGLGSEHCVGCIVYGLSAASLSSPLKQNEEEIDSLRIQVHELLKK
ncbi:hypothetical protein KY290_018526 [Solanum tuberosum]|uniref:Uncharacterized protein n=1 Tax=Solanum tuberosum TaxID=4113 RepID=A0ABQ7VEG4_SOLTU|nr:hypothetical protein KY289_017647 [Solanum tuberosum]KAH0762453.1 hypothetical protein KY290_018526 [Solanum tuberosum]